MEPAKPPATIKLKNGSQINGEVLEMKNGELKVKTDFGGDVPIKWTEVTELLSELKLRLVLEGDRTLDGTVTPGDGDTIEVRTTADAAPILVPFTAVTAINPPDPAQEKPVSYKGNVNLGVSVIDGNSRTKSANSNAELVVRADDHRLTLRSRWNYAEDSSRVSTRNARGSVKYDYFVTERLYLFASTLFEGDSFQNLELRIVPGGGVGYQFVEKGDFENEHLAKLAAYGEVGVSYFFEDLQDTTTNEYVAGRWSLDVDWEFLPDNVSFFHHHEGYPSFEDQDDVLLVTEQGLRFKLLSGLIATLQINWRWDNVPAAGVQRSDTTYLVTLGYQFEG